MRPLTPLGPSALSFALRGPELAVLVPAQDLTALLEVCRYLSNTWNGPGTLLLPVTAQGEISSGLEPSLSALPPDRFLVHPDVPATARQALSAEWGDRVVDWRKRSIDQEIHPWWLIRDGVADRVPLPSPMPVSDTETLLASVLWGHIEEDDLEVISKQFEPVPVAADEFFPTLLEAQLSRLSPLSWAARFTDFVECVNGPNQRALFIFDAEVTPVREVIAGQDIPSRSDRIHLPCAQASFCSSPRLNSEAAVISASDPAPTRKLT